MSSKPQSSPVTTLQRVQSLYDRNLFLEAYRETAGRLWILAQFLNNSRN